MAETRTARRRGLGMGLSSLLGPDPEMWRAGPAGEDGSSRAVPIEFLRPSPLQPRRTFGAEEMEALTRSIAEKGVLQPLLARPARHGAPGYEIVAGERRWRAAQRAGLHEVPVVVRELADGEVLELALVENVQRADLSPIEEAEALRRLTEEFGHTQEALASLVGKSRSHIANTLRLLALPAALRELVEERKLSAGHARALLTTRRPEALAHEVVNRGLSVRETERLVRVEADGKRPRGARPVDPDLARLEERLARSLGLEVAIRTRAAGGTVSIRFRRHEQLDAVLARLC